MPVLHCFDFCNFVVNFEIGKSESSNFYFKIVLDIQGSWHSHINFRISFSISAKKAIGFSRDFIESIDLFGGILCLNNIKSYNLWTWDVFLFI